MARVPGRKLMPSGPLSCPTAPMTIGALVPVQATAVVPTAAPPAPGLVALPVPDPAAGAAFVGPLLPLAPAPWVDAAVPVPTADGSDADGATAPVPASTAAGP